mmetsp:Transcript_39791/g.100303  ORF Transcript_39791/g.100303 Transcript_39791/m.100303 type:complete len:356 (+) Transcript_39791:98-1165(+)|eukprot:CAMPEP_0177647050 /NCGR_PEP_ID=MMETSP0447-20121125/10099_1 /TAXON_ID=0 /ORGANISM="Stygamoeba regulata, Strain BSH-02190019" /LENGTH=355 /DNA_ID=CAMNT_0019149621 /DNA_START=113 /DNA_END=1180 /DNA_ORIENTATION=-
MACFGKSNGGDVDPEAKKRSQEIDSELKSWAAEEKKIHKLLLLGPGESGKSTIFKQMRIIESGCMPEDQRKSYRYIVFANCISQMKAVVQAAEQLDIPMDNDDNKERAAKISKLPATGESWCHEVGTDIRMLWYDKGIQKTYEQRDAKYQLNDSAGYFFQSIDRFLLPEYVPNEQDVLRARVRSTGIEEAQFVHEDFKFTMMDVGGQRSERRKWIHCFDAVTAVIFCASLSEFDQRLREDETQNRMKETLLLFEDICNSPWFRNIAIILFLNKTDLFREKLQRVQFKDFYPEYAGPNEYKEVLDFIQKMYESRNTTPRRLYVHHTCAINTDNVTFVFKAVREKIMVEILDQIGIY